MTDPAVRLKQVSKRFKAGVDILTGIDLAVAPGELVALVGASGCGKTTLLRMAAGLEEPSEGSVEVLGRSPAQACALRQVGVAFQRAALVPSRTALEMSSSLWPLPGEPTDWIRHNSFEISVWVSISMPILTSFRAGCSSASTSPPLWFINRKSCCWTSRSVPWTKLPANP